MKLLLRSPGLACLAALSVCLPAVHAVDEPPAQLVTHTLEKTNPNATFTIRFARPMVDAAAVGKPAETSPVELQPAVKGRFTWLSTRSGTFAPEEPLPLSTTFRFILRPGLKTPGGEALAGPIAPTFDTPPMLLKGWSTPGYIYEGDAPVDPEFNLLFNADVVAADAAKFLTFIDAAGQKVAAKVVQADPAHHPRHRFPTYRSNDQSVLTWADKFREKITPALGARRPDTGRQNQLFVTPAEPLRPGDQWKLVIAEGLPSTEPGVSLLEKQEVKVGNIRPFVVRSLEAVNDGQGGRRMVVRFAKALAETVKPENIGQWIKITPSPRKVTVRVDRAEVVFTGDFKLETEYRVDVAAGIPAAQPFTLKEAWFDAAIFEPIPPSLVVEGFATHQLSTGTRHFHLKAVNVPKIRVTAKLFPPETAPLALRRYDDYLNPPNPKDDELHRKIDPSQLPGKVVFSRVINGTDQVDTEREIKLAWNDILGRGKSGVVLLTAEQVGRESRPGVQAIVQVTDLGLVWKASKAETFAHVFSLAAGGPLAGVKVHLLDAEEKVLGETTTDASGTAVLPALDKARWLRAVNGGDLHVVDLEDDSGALSLYRFRMPYLEEDAENENVGTRQVLLFTERDVYRPGETVHLKGIVRDPRSGEPRIPAGIKARLKAFDDREREIFTRDVTLTEFGSFDAEIPLPKGPLGTYSATLSFGKADAEESLATHEFEVQEYTPNAFEITIAGPEKLPGAEAVELPVSGKYLMGKSLSQAELSWSIDASDAGFKPEGFKDFSFCDAIDDYRLNNLLDRASHFSDQGKLQLGEDGKAVVTTTIPINPKAPQPRKANLLCEITDLNQQTVSKAAARTVDASDFYLGVGQLPEVVQKGDRLELPVVAVRTDGTQVPEPVKARIRVTRIDWQNNRVVTDDDASETTSEPIFKVISEAEVQTQRVELSEHRWKAMGEPAVTLTAGEPGLYLLEALGTDARGRAVLTSTSFYVTGENVTEWNYRNDYQIELVPDKLGYLSTETARLLVKTPISGDALVTVERDRVLRSFTTRLTGNAPSIEIPLAGTDAPNVFVSVVLLRGAKDSPRKFKEPDYRAGYCQLQVTRPDAKLSVYVKTDRKAYQPAQEVNLEAEVRDITGKPRAQAEVTLYAVDEGVLSLTEYETPNPYAFFNKPIPLSVYTHLTLPMLLREDPAEKSFENKGYMIGGGGDLGEAFRKNFVTCALWSANLRTDDQGRVKTRLTAPDSLTRYRVIAVVQTRDDAFGSGESAFEVNKPVMLEPALPRFANVGDQLNLRGVLHNLTEVGGEVEVQLELDDTATAATTRRVVTLPARGSLAVDFPVEFVKTGEAKWKWVARFTGSDGRTAYRDAVQSTLKVGFPVAPRREVKLQRVTEPEVNLLRDADPALLEGTGVARVTLGNSRAIELRESLDQLLHYPYGCVEQTASSTLPWIVLKDFRAALPNLARSDEQFRDAVNRGIDRLFSMQTSGGGLGYWPGAREPHLWGSSYAGLALALARRGGYALPDGPFDSLCKYLSAELRGTAELERGYALSERCLALYALALAGRAEPAYHEVFFKKSHLLNPESRAVLALAIAEAKGSGEMIAELLSPAKSSAYDDDPFWCSSRDQAIRLMAWSRFQPNAPQVEAGMAELFGQRHGGHWLTTQGNCWALMAIADYLRLVEKPEPEVAGRVAWGENAAAFKLVADAPVHRAEMPIAPGADRLPMTLANPGAKRLYTEVELVAHPRGHAQPREDQGYSIERHYAKISDDGSLADFRDGVVGERVLVTLKIVVRERARYVAVEDPLPSIFEAVNPVFKSQATRAGEVLGQEWPGDYQELRDDRALFFADYLSPGEYTIRYLARVRAAGRATAPSAKVEEMYRPQRFGLTETARVTSVPLK